MQFRYVEDLDTVKELLNLNEADLASGIGVTPMTLSRWRLRPQQISVQNLNQFYSFAYQSGIRLNRIKERLFTEDYQDENHVILFHGARNAVEGEITIEKSRRINDFGRGFYCGDTFRQSSMFVCGYPHASVYIVRFEKSRDLKMKQYLCDLDWILTVALCRGRLERYADHPKLEELRKELKRYDYVIAPAADNRMFMLLDAFAEGRITDRQCCEAIARRNLGNEYVFLSERALKHVSLLTRCYLAEKEKEDMRKGRSEENTFTQNKRKEEGRTIDQLLS
ncbi:MAG: DUF3990 domain-containing protein [Solobacterium sp.]|nr:DUF3990 domain-containing protein [Solobacterium sp.]